MNKTITKITYNGQEMSIYIPSFNITPQQYFSKSFSQFVDGTGFYQKLRENVFLDQNATSIYLPKLSNLTSRMFYNCDNLTDLTFMSVSNIPSNTFYQNISLNLNSLPIWDAVKIEDYGFSGTNLPSQTTFSQCKEVGDYAFLNANIGNNVDLNINLPKCSKFGEGAFARCTRLTQISVPLMTKIPAKCFEGCSRLSTINTDNIEEIGSFAFKSCYSLVELSFSNVTNIGGSAFSSCSNLNKLTFTKIGSYSWSEAFVGTSLKELVCNATNIIGRTYFPYSTIEKLELPHISQAYGQLDIVGNMPKLKEVNFNGLITVSSSASLLYSCSSLEKVSLPNLQSAGSSAFYGCSKLSQAVFTLPSVVTLGNASCFRNTPMQNSTYLGYYGSIYVPARLVDIYKSATNWAQYSNRITSIENLPE